MIKKIQFLILCIFANLLLLDNLYSNDKKIYHDSDHPYHSYSKPGHLGEIVSYKNNKKTYYQPMDANHSSLSFNLGYADNNLLVNTPAEKVKLDWKNKNYELGMELNYYLTKHTNMILEYKYAHASSGNAVEDYRNSSSSHKEKTNLKSTGSYHETYWSLSHNVYDHKHLAIYPLAGLFYKFATIKSKPIKGKYYHKTHSIIYGVNLGSEFRFRISKKNRLFVRAEYLLPIKYIAQNKEFATTGLRKYKLRNKKYEFSKDIGFRLKAEFKHKMMQRSAFEYFKIYGYFEQIKFKGLQQKYNTDKQWQSSTNSGDKNKENVKFQTIGAGIAFEF
tara:strand:+ start:595 stop:1593 length:999 start_codon:yes stop_codon:yes gene_type:complete